MNNADAILADLESAADATNDEEIIEPLSRVLAGILRIDGRDQISNTTLSLILKPFWLAEAAAREVLPDWYWHERGKHGFHGAYGLLRSWAQPPNSAERSKICEPGTDLIVRIVANEFDTLVAAYAYQRVGPKFAPMSVLMPVQHVPFH